ncbi:MAG: chemotaxis protein CheD [Planctomycetaceae bacterium]
MLARTMPSIPMGAIGVSQNNGHLRTLLGSCIGLALFDRIHKVGALAHIVLPASNGKCELPGKFVDTAVPEMLRQMEKVIGDERLKLTAKIAGGANMFGATSASVATVGNLNIAAIERLLEEHRIPITARHLGGEQGRRMTLDTTTGIVTIEIVGAETVTL